MIITPISSTCSAKKIKFTMIGEECVADDATETGDAICTAFKDKATDVLVTNANNDLIPGEFTRENVYSYFNG